MKITEKKLTWVLALSIAHFLLLLIQIGESSKPIEVLKRPLSVQLRSALKRKKISRSMQGLKALKMGKDFKFIALGDKKEEFSQMGGGLGSFLTYSVIGNIDHIGINGLVELNLFLDENGKIDIVKSRAIGKSKELCQHVKDYFIKMNSFNKPFWKNLASNKKIKIKLFFLGSINSRELVNTPGEQSYISGDELIVNVYKEITPYNYSKSINLLNF